jgi:large subunit ribosomal protein L31
VRSGGPDAGARLGQSIARMIFMKSSIHPTYIQAHVKCTCGNEFTTRSTRDEIHVEVCSNCHPFYTGRQRLVDTGGRVERFQRRVAKGRLRSAQTGASSSGTSTQTPNQ